jgi:DNA modification methylase
VSWEIRQGDALERLRELPDESVQCCVTSPPYWGLRDYGVDGQLGIEATPAEFVAGLVQVFAEVRRVLRDDGTLWLNLGDSYATSGDRGVAHKGPRLQGTAQLDRGAVRGGRAPSGQLKSKDLVGIPWRAAMALCQDGWYLRSDTIEEVEFFCPCGCGHVMEERIWRHSPDREVIWSKSNPMPESVKDRPTRSHEYLFLLSKSRRYFYDAGAIREQPVWEGQNRSSREAVASQVPGAPTHKGLRHDKQRGHIRRHDGFNDRWDSISKDEQQALGRNKRSVWKIATRPYPDAHFATFPPDLVEPCILAGSAEGDTVLDPFAGAATTGLVALRHNRSFIGIELNPEYVELGRNRLRDDAPLLNTPAELVGATEISGGGLRPDDR